MEQRNANSNSSNLITSTVAHTDSLDLAPSSRLELEAYTITTLNRIATDTVVVSTPLNIIATTTWALHMIEQTEQPARVDSLSI